MTVRLVTTVKKIENIINQENRETILRFYEFIKKNGTFDADKAKDNGNSFSRNHKGIKRNQSEN